ncbi:hypothetical protein SAMN04488105_11618 [Salipiger thiooxidans]|uniref:DUF3329 domain-containing protein n=1 Tax=Salipiger thiooxidans TaxID=282683 RepID=A0A1G7JRJ0_9RHOB|nr:hypothetical protein [Salipiger thiooxidans]SDF27578.1 hypothetical protein SAMN04488105_11618 [Salipiger thiooxidans]
MFDLQSPWLAPLWRRIAITVVAIGWALVELSSGAHFWAALFGAAGLWCAYQFFVVWDAEIVAARAAKQNETEDDQK